MRTISLVTSLLLIFTLQLSANNSAPLPGKFKVRTMIKDHSTLMLTIVNLQQEKAVVSLRNLSNRDLVYREVIKDHNGYRMALHLHQLPAGRYVLEIKKGDSITHQVVRVSRNLVLLSQMSENT